MNTRFYERFGPGGLKAENVGNVLGGNEEGDYLMNVGSMRAHIPHDPSGRPAMICMTSLRDVARFIVATLVSYNVLFYSKLLTIRRSGCPQPITMAA